VAIIVSSPEIQQTECDENLAPLYGKSRRTEKISYWLYMSSERHLHPVVLSASSDYLGFRREQWVSAIIEELKGKSEDEFCSSLETINYSVIREFTAGA